MNEIRDKKITQSEVDNLMAPLELDLLALFKVMLNDMLDYSEEYEGSPENYINNILSYLTEEPKKIIKNLYKIKKKSKLTRDISMNEDETKCKRIIGGKRVKIIEKKDKKDIIKKGDNMPKPKPGETEQEFISRCIPVVKKEGVTQDQAVGKCFGIYKNKMYKLTKESIDSLIRKLK